MKTVERIVEETDWTPPPETPTPDVIVAVRIEVAERALQKAVNAAGGVWRPAKLVWELPYGQVVALGLQDRICDHAT